VKHRFENDSFEEVLHVRHVLVITRAPEPCNWSFPTCYRSWTKDKKKRSFRRLSGLETCRKTWRNPWMRPLLPYHLLHFQAFLPHLRWVVFLLRLPWAVSRHHHPHQACPRRLAHPPSSPSRRSRRPNLPTRWNRSIGPSCRRARSAERFGRRSTTRRWDHFSRLRCSTEQ